MKEKDTNTESYMYNNIVWYILDKEERIIENKKFRSGEDTNFPQNLGKKNPWRTQKKGGRLKKHKLFEWGGWGYVWELLQGVCVVGW